MKNAPIRFKDIVKPLSVRQFWALVILAPLIFMPITWPSSFDNLPTFLKVFSWYSIVGITQSLGHSYIATWLDRWVTWEESPKKRAVISIVAIVLYSVVAYIVVGTMLALFWLDVSFQGALETAIAGIWIAVKISSGFALVFATITFFLNWRKTLIQSERLEKELANYRYDTLKNQVNPHFLFNSLNVLTDLVHEDADLSEKYIQQLSKIYRYILESAKHKIVPLSEEVAFIDSYIFLLKIRFGDKLKVEMDIQALDGEYIVPVAIQMLMENAVKHNQITREHPLSIRLFKKNGRVFVQNAYQPKERVANSTGTGLVNLEQQFKVFTKETMKIEQDDGYFTVSLPLLENKKESA